MWTVLELPIMVIAADLVIGLAHWGMDSFGQPECPVLGSTFKANQEHHARPRAFLKHSWLHNSDVLLIIAVVIVVIGWLTGVLGWQLWVFAVIIATTNLVHRFAHQTRKENGCFISALQDLRIIQRRNGHARHHGGNQNTHYAPVTNLVNPILEAINFWRCLERLFERYLGLKPHGFKP